ncbi:hypothetical protein CYY_009208 [Polysphondylium violaceum]|uniref:Uncharacterized protein n=1 Tax=Polysphondylium violaceum TaxID=133409 RepID=A0A8J4PKE2_9MYCE|nr:hypothetical protein CYY_009208 [Polysphondylium violaceum]
MINTLFFSVWANNYIRGLVCAFKCKEREINVDLDYLNNNHQYLYLLSLHDKLKHNIYVKLSINNKDQLDQYQKNKYNNLINHVEINIENEQQQQQPPKGQDQDFLIIDCDTLPLGLQILVIYVDARSVCLGELPYSIDQLVIRGAYKIKTFFICQLVNHVLMNLPYKIRYLDLPNSVQVHTLSNICLPESLIDLDYCSSYNNLQKFIVPPNKVYDGCKLRALSMDDLIWLHNKLWVSHLEIFDGINVDFIRQYTIASHIRSLVVFYHADFEIGSLPDTLESFTGYNSRSTQQFRGVLPPNLKNLTLSLYGMRLEKGILPPSLVKLSIGTFDDEIEDGALPPGLELLKLNSFDQPIYQGIFPDSLTELHLEILNRPLLPNTLPSSLKTLVLENYNSEILGLPSSLTRLQLNSYSGSLENVGVLENLQDLTIIILRQSIINVLTSSNIKRMKLTFFKKETGVNLSDTFIQDLTLVCTGPIPDIDASFFPTTLKSLITLRINIIDVPFGCKYTSQ